MLKVTTGKNPRIFYNDKDITPNIENIREIEYNEHSPYVVIYTSGVEKRYSIYNLIDGELKIILSDTTKKKEISFIPFLRGDADVFKINNTFYERKDNEIKLIKDIYKIDKIVSGFVYDKHKNYIVYTKNNSELHYIVFKSNFYSTYVIHKQKNNIMFLEQYSSSDSLTQHLFDGKNLIQISKQFNVSNDYEVYVDIIEIDGVTWITYIDTSFNQRLLKFKTLDNIYSVNLPTGTYCKRNANAFKTENEVTTLRVGEFERNKNTDSITYIYNGKTFVPIISMNHPFFQELKSKEYFIYTEIDNIDGKYYVVVNNMYFFELNIKTLDITYFLKGFFLGVISTMGSMLFPMGKGYGIFSVRPKYMKKKLGIGLNEQYIVRKIYVSDKK